MAILRLHKKCVFPGPLSLYQCINWKLAPETMKIDYKQMQSVWTRLICFRSVKGTWHGLAADVP